MSVEQFYFDFYNSRPLSGMREIENKKTKNIYENVERRLLSLSTYNRRIFSNSKRKTIPIFLEKEQETNKKTI